MYAVVELDETEIINVYLRQDRKDAVARGVETALSYADWDADEVQQAIDNVGWFVAGDFRVEIACVTEE